MKTTNHPTQKSQSDPAWSDLLVRFCDGHPHAGEYGVPTGKVIEVGPSRRKMYEFNLLNCAHGEEGCFAEKGTARLVPDDERPSFAPAARRTK